MLFIRNHQMYIYFLVLFLPLLYCFVLRKTRRVILIKIFKQLYESFNII